MVEEGNIILELDPNYTFTAVPNTVIDDWRLSWKAVGIFGYIWKRGQMENWKLKIEDLINRHTDGKDGVRSGILELRAGGYIHIRRNRNKEGKIIGTIWKINIIPFEHIPDTEIPYVEKPKMDNPPLYIKDNTKKEKDINIKEKSRTKSRKPYKWSEENFNIYSENFEYKWGFMPSKKKKYKQKAAETLDKADLSSKEDKQLENYIIVYAGLYKAGLVGHYSNGEFIPEMQDLHRVIKERRFTEIDTLPDPAIQIVTVGNQTEKSAAIKHFKDRGEYDKVKIIIAKSSKVW